MTTITITLEKYECREHAVPNLAPDTGDEVARAKAWLSDFKDWVDAQPDGAAIRLITALDEGVNIKTLMNCIFRGIAVATLDENKRWRFGEQG